MPKSELKHRTKLNTEQLEILKLLNKFRYGSKELVTQYLGKKDQSYVFRRLEVLLSLGLIAKRYESNYRLLGKPAAYHLTPTGARLLYEQQEGNDSINMKLVYKNKDVSEDFIEQCLQILGLHNQLHSLYGNALQFFTRSDLVTYDYFPQPLPSAFISLKSGKKITGRFFVELIDESKPFFTVKKRIRQYLNYDETGVWDDTGTDFPVVLLICSSQSFSSRLTKYINSLDLEINLVCIQKAELAENALPNYPSSLFSEK